MKKIFLFLAAVVSTAVMAQQADPISDGVGAVITVAGETKNEQNVVQRDSVQSTKDSVPQAVKPLWKQKLYYGYNFDIYFHTDSRSDRKENGWSIALEPEIGWRLKERVYLGLRLSGRYENSVTRYDISLIDTTYSTDLRVHYGSWQVTPYMRYRLKTMFNGKLGIWLECHLFAGMSYPRVSDGEKRGTDLDGLRYSANYGFQVSPVITYQFNKKSTFQIFFSILSAGYSGTAYSYRDPSTGASRTEYTNDIIIFWGKLRNLLANQFTPGLYGLKFGVQKSF